MMNKTRLFAALAAATVLLTACSSSEEDARKAAEESRTPLCQFDKTNTATTRIAHVKWTGGLYNTEIDVKEWQENGQTSVFSALARPKNTRYQANSRQDCYDATKKIYYPCHVKVDVNLAALSSVGRAPDSASAKFTAQYNCERLAVGASHEASKSGLIESSAFDCEVVEVRECPIPKKP